MKIRFCFSEDAVFVQGFEWRRFVVAGWVVFEEPLADALGSGARNFR